MKKVEMMKCLLGYINISQRCMIITPHITHITCTQYYKKRIMTIPGHDNKASTRLSGTCLEDEGQVYLTNLPRPWYAPVFCTQFVLWHTFPNHQSPYVGGVGSLNLKTAIAFHHCPLWSEWGCSSDNQISQHALHGLNCSRMKTPMGTYAIELKKLTDKWIKAISVGRFSVKEPRECSFFSLLKVIYYIQSRNQPDFTSVELYRQNVSMINQVRNLRSVTLL